TVYIDHHQVLTQSNMLRGRPYESLGLEGVIREVELRQAAYLLFMRDVPSSATIEPQARSAALERLHERVLWTAIRYGEPDAAVADVIGLAANDGPSPELHEAALRVRAKLPAGLRGLDSKEARAEALHRAAEASFPTIGG
ncbi:hypothetical protein HY251_18635, partial [bacterium]|nr:hypothetical protein [bacterium]